MVASDRSIGGFGHTWGEDSPKVQRKRRLLEGEGVVFEENGKIHKHCFVDASSETSTTSTTKSNTKVSKKRKVEDATVKTTSTKTSAKKKKKSKSKYFNNASETETILKKEILDLLQKRQVGKTC